MNTKTVIAARRNFAQERNFPFVAGYLVMAPIVQEKASEVAARCDLPRRHGLPFGSL
jgi:hypothetical protein